MIFSVLAFLNLRRERVYQTKWKQKRTKTSISKASARRNKWFYSTHHRAFPISNVAILWLSCVAFLYFSNWALAQRCCVILVFFPYMCILNFEKNWLPNGIICVEDRVHTLLRLWIICLLVAVFFCQILINIVCKLQATTNVFSLLKIFIFGDNWQLAFLHFRFSGTWFFIAKLGQKKANQKAFMSVKEYR